MTAAQHFINRNQLPQSYLQSAERWFSLLLEQFASQYQPQLPPQILGINGSQGSGKSTMADYLCSIAGERHGIQTVNLSMDDFYLTKQQRLHLADTVHPLLATRGVPGTHDIELMIETINSLKAGKPTLITRFDKSTDDRVPASQLEMVTGPVGLIIIEGWCLGATAASDSDLINPINELERRQDSQGVWRHYVNRALAGSYQQLFFLIDQLIMLQAPSFERVFKWRLEQETKLRKSLAQDANSPDSALMNDQQIKEFIQYFQRITEQLLSELPRRAQHLYPLDDQRKIICYLRRQRTPKTKNPS
ncbi:MAG: hypothetical protein HN817_08935 [Porticoccaceae bacterium]|jgi:D-glycerate 3-kinase|nr:hypothetical protein [Porticoccaceae bacterium]MBT7376040.1 hypothetical protein [Porticoccaceae bacterium]